jgi:hypothetical protein
MSNTHIAVKPVPTAAPLVSVVKKSVFAFKTRPEIAPKGLRKAIFISALNEESLKKDDEFNRVTVTVELVDLDRQNKHFVLTKVYNILPSGRGFSAFIKDMNAWSGAALTEDDLYVERNYTEEFGGNSLVVEVSRRKDGKEWEAVIEAFHPEGYTGEVQA